PPLSLLPFPTRTYTTAQSPAACILHPRTANAYTVGPSPAPGSVRCLQLLGRTWLAPIPESRDHPLHRPFLDKLISENGPAENPQEIILNSLPCKCLFLWDLSRHRFQPDCLLRPLKGTLVFRLKPESNKPRARAQGPAKAQKSAFSSSIPRKPAEEEKFLWQRQRQSDRGQQIGRARRQLQQ